MKVVALGPVGVSCRAKGGWDMPVKKMGVVV